MFQTTNQILYNISIPSDSQTWTIPQLLSYRCFKTKPSVYEGFPSQTCLITEGYIPITFSYIRNHIPTISELYPNYSPITIPIIYLNYYPDNISINPYHR